MIQAVGIDSIEIARFSEWHTKSRTQLRHILSDAEIDYCLQNRTKSSERFAAHFAAKEAFYKALHTVIKTDKLPFFTVCRHVEIIREQNGAPRLAVDWQLYPQLSGTVALCSVTHTKTTATVMVVLTRIHP